MARTVKTAEEKLAARNERTAARQASVAGAVTKIATLNQNAMNLQLDPSDSIRDRIDVVLELGRDAMKVRSDADAAITNKSFRASVEILLTQADDTIGAAWTDVLDSISALEVENETLKLNATPKSKKARK